MKRSFLILSLVIFISIFSKAQEPTIATCAGLQTFCLTQNTFDLCVEITLNPDFMDPIDHFEIDWGDNSPILSIPNSSNPTVAPHTYDFVSFFNTCNYDEKYFVTLTTYVTNGPPVANIIPVTFINPPQAMFSINSPVICEGDEVCFNDTPCPSENLEIISWDYGDGTMGLDDCHVYSQAGTYTVTLTVENPCGQSTVSQILQVIQAAEAEIAVTSSNIDISASPFIYCLGSGLVDLDGDSLSNNETIYEWQSINSISGVSYVTDPPSNDATPNGPDLSLSFSDTGLFQIILEVDNACGQPDSDTIFIQVLTGQGLSPLNQVNACLTLNYTPNGYNPDATYTINGVVETNFPTMLGVGTYTVTCDISNECGSQTQSETFEVFGQENVSILFPSSDTTLCVGSDSIMILYDPTGGDWMGDHLIFYGDSVFFDPVEVGVFEIFYKKGIGNCEDIESIIFTVEGVNITANDVEICSTSDPFLMLVSPSGGTFSSTACPSCISGDTFIVSELITNNLASVEVSYIVASNSGCEGNNTFTVSVEDPLAAFSVDSIFCLGDPVMIDFTGAVGLLTWMIDGQMVGPPPFTNLNGGAHTIKLTAVAGNCEDEQTHDIYITSPPANVSFTAMPLEGCADLDVMLTNQTGAFDNPSFEWYIDDSLFSTAIQPGIITLESGLSDTTYTITLSAGNSCNGQNFTQTITVFPKPVPRFGPMQNYYCSGDTVTFSNVSVGGPMNNWLWDYGNGMTSTDSIPLQVIYFTDTIPITYSVSLTATNDCGTETFTYDLVINPTDVKAFFNIDPIEGCVGVPVCLTNLSTLGTNVLWDFGDGNTSTLSSLCHTYQQAGTYNIKLKAFGCGFDSIQTQVVINPMPTASFSNNTISCPGDTMVFSNNSILANSFLWDFGDGTTSTLNNPSHVYASSGSYLVKLFVTTLEGCEDSTMSNITVLSPPSAIFTSGLDSICVESNIVFTNNSIPSPFTCLWDFGDGNFSNNCNPSHSYLIEGTYTASLIITNSDGCRDTASQQLIVAPLPTPAFNFNQMEDCSPSVVAFINQTTVGESYVWDFGDGMISTETNPTHTYLSGGIYNVELTATIGVCSRTINQIITVVQTPNTEIITPLGQEGCADWDASFSASPVGNNFNYKWDFGDGAFSFDGDAIHTFSLPGVYNVSLIVDDNGNCPDTAFSQIEVFEPISANTATIDNLCFGDEMGEVDVSILTGTSNFQFQWSNGSITEDISNLSAGTYTITVEDNNGCIWSEEVEILQPDAPLSINILDEDIVTCYGGSDGGISIEVNGGTEDYNYLWENETTLPSINNVSAGNYNITITDANNCILEEILTVNQNDSISYNAMISNISCFGFDDGQINLENFSGGVAPYFATLIELDSLQGTGFNNLLPGEYSFIVSDGEGCVQNFNTSIVEPPQVWIELDEDSVTIQLGEKLEIKGNYNVANPIFSWGPDRWLDCYDCDEPVAFPFADITYNVLMVDENGCFDSDTIFIEVIDERGIAVPNIFTPNNDGQNDVFTLLGRNPAVVEVASFKVYDRHGGILHQVENFPLNDPTFGWNGKHNGSDVQVGNYVYTVLLKYVDGGKLEWQGSFMLVR